MVGVARLFSDLSLQKQAWEVGQTEKERTKPAQSHRLNAKPGPQARSSASQSSSMTHEEFTDMVCDFGEGGGQKRPAVPHKRITVSQCEGVGQ